MDEESQRRVILSCSLTLASEIILSQRSISRASGVQGRRVGGLNSRRTEVLWGKMGHGQGAVTWGCGGPFLNSAP